jgi:cytochrome c
MWRPIAVAAFGLALSGSGALAQATGGDPAAGEKVFNKCKTCHNVGEGAKIKVGPPLNGIVGRPAASWEGFQYSKAAKEHATVTGTWEVEEIFTYLADPNKFLGGPSKMVFKLPNEQERQNVIAYLGQFDISGKKK